MLIGLNRLKKIIDDTIEGETGIIHSKCIGCGFQVAVEVHKTSEGYGLLRASCMRWKAAFMSSV
jgi:hypothetical protein